MHPSLRIALIASFCTACASAWASEQPTLLELSASAQRDVSNDRLNATLYIQLDQNQPMQLATRLNQTINQALAMARQFPHVTASTGAYTSWPEYAKNGSIQGWHGRAEIRLNSMDFIQGAQLVAQLQKTMLLQNVDFSVADTTRKKLEQEMLPDAIKQLQATAQVAARSLGKTHVQVRELTVGNQGNAPRPLYSMMTRSGGNDSAAVATPDWQPGQTTVQMQVSGKLELY